LKICPGLSKVVMQRPNLFNIDKKGTPTTSSTLDIQLETNFLISHHF